MSDEPEDDDIRESRVQDLLERLTADADLRDRFRSSPIGILEEFGIELTGEQEELLKSQWSKPTDDELMARVWRHGIRPAWL